MCLNTCKLLVCNIIIAILTVSCRSNNLEEFSESYFKSEKLQGLYGTFVSNGYFNRKIGADWVSVQISPYNTHFAQIRIRSRADQKAPTCTMDQLALIRDEGILTFQKGASEIWFRLSEEELMIAGNNLDTASPLFFYCSGGGSLSNTYTRIGGRVDTMQVDQREYVKTFHDKNANLRFRLEADKQYFTLFSEGLDQSTEPINVGYSGRIIHAELEDLDIDGWPELYVYTQDTEIPYSGEVIGYSVNNGKSLSPITITNIITLDSLGKGYVGLDEFAVVENRLVRRFIYNDGFWGTEFGTRQVQYKLTKGEASWQLIPDKVIEFLNLP